MRALVLVANLAACSEATVEIGVELSLDTLSCQSTAGEPVPIDGPEDISLACDNIRVGQFVRTDATILASECAEITGAPPTPDGLATLADVPRLLAGFRSPALDAGTMVSVLLEISNTESSASCEPVKQSPGSTSAASIWGESQAVALGEGVETIRVMLACNGALPCDVPPI